MQESHDSSHREPLTIEQLLRFKRLEKPAPDFWLSFEREFQQKQLRALVKPSKLQRLRSVLRARAAFLAPLSGTAAIAVMTVVWLSPPAGQDAQMERSAATVAADDRGSISGNADTVALVGDPAHRAETLARRTDTHFVEDALVPERRAVESFRTVALPETLVASSEPSSYYVVNAFTAGGPVEVSIPDGLLEF